MVVSAAITGWTYQLLFVNPSLTIHQIITQTVSQQQYYWFRCRWGHMLNLHLFRCVRCRNSISNQNCCLIFLSLRWATLRTIILNKKTPPIKHLLFWWFIYVYIFQLLCWVVVDVSIPIPYSCCRWATFIFHFYLYHQPTLIHIAAVSI